MSMPTFGLYEILLTVIDQSSARTPSVSRVGLSVSAMLPSALRPKLPSCRPRAEQRANAARPPDRHMPEPPTSATGRPASRSRTAGALAALGARWQRMILSRYRGVTLCAAKSIKRSTQGPSAMLSRIRMGLSQPTQHMLKRATSYPAQRTSIFWKNILWPYRRLRGQTV